MVVGDPIRITIPSNQAKNFPSHGSPVVANQHQGSHPTLHRAHPIIGQQQSTVKESKSESQTTHQKILSKFANGQGPKGPIGQSDRGHDRGQDRGYDRGQDRGHDRGQNGQPGQTGLPGFNVSIVGPTGSNQPVNKLTNQHKGNIFNIV